MFKLDKNTYYERIKEFSPRYTEAIFYEKICDALLDLKNPGDVDKIITELCEEMKKQHPLCEDFHDEFDNPNYGPGHCLCEDCRNLARFDNYIYFFSYAADEVAEAIVNVVKFFKSMKLRCERNNKKDKFGFRILFFEENLKNFKVRDEKGKEVENLEEILKDGYFFYEFNFDTLKDIKFSNISYCLWNSKGYPPKIKIFEKD